MHTTRLRGARTNNLQGIDLDLEPGSTVVIAGVSGAGKSSLAFSTLYAEGQRRYVESFSAYARQFLERLARPPVDHLDPIAAGIAVDRQAPVRTSRSTVGTMTEIADYAKSLWARAATLRCPTCSRDVRPDTRESAVDALLARHAGKRCHVVYAQPVIDAEAFVGVRESLVASGFRRVRVDGAIRDLDEVRPSDVVGDAASAPKKKAKVAKKKVAKKTSKKKKVEAPVSAARVPTLEVVVDRLTIGEADRGRLGEAIETAFRHGRARAAVFVEGVEEAERFSSGLHCAHCDRSFRDPTPGLFSFNNPIGACEVCRGFGRTIGVDWDKVLPDTKKTLSGGAVACWRGESSSWERRELAKHAAAAGVPMDRPIAELSDTQLAWLKEGDSLGYPRGWFGLKGWFQWLESRAYKMHVRVLLSRYRSYEDCATCRGARLKAEALDWSIDDGESRRSIAAFFGLPAAEARRSLSGAMTRLEALGPIDPPTALLAREIDRRLETLIDVGLGYLTLDRSSRTLSGGEAQRVSLTSALSSSLTGAMFVLDEPTVGLHPSDVEKLVKVLDTLAGDDNVALIVEHDLDVIAAADRVVELGPGSGEHGGRIVFDGSPSELTRRAETPTGRALATEVAYPRTRQDSPQSIELRGARGNNLRGVDVRIPRGALTAITGVSGSGKSTLVVETLVPALEARLGVDTGTVERALAFDSLEGTAGLSGVVHVDQSPLGRTSRGNAATYLGVWDVIRKRFVKEPLAVERGYGEGFFSFNVAGGRCETCKGDGAETVEMQFLADVTFSCPDCGGKRFVGPVLDVTHRGLDVAAWLELTADDALLRFEGDKAVAQKLRPMVDVGLGYLKLGQSLNQLSGGEAQRLKLALALGESKKGSVVVLDEPTAGLHPEDTKPLMAVIDRLVSRGDTVIVVEHEMRVAAAADWVIDLGPGAGAEGGEVVAMGPPELVAKDPRSRTAPHLARALARRGALIAARPPREARTTTGSTDIVVTRAHEHNLKDIDVVVPRGSLVTVTGPSGSGKSTLAFDIIFAEGQRRYLETLSPYARQYLPQLPRPNVDRVTGVPPTVALEQRLARGGANSTVATVTEVAHFLRLLYARAGVLHCTRCDVPITARAPAQIVDDAKNRLGAQALAVYAPVVRGRKGHYREQIEGWMRDGFTHAKIDGVERALEAGMSLARFVEHQIALLVGREKVPHRLETAVRRAAELADGSVIVESGSESLLFSTKRACPRCGDGYPELDPRFFSFNTAQGRCASCEGHGVTTTTVGRGKTAREVSKVCEVCEGSRLSPLARGVRLDGRRIPEILRCSVADARRELDTIHLSGRDAAIGEVPIAECRKRLAFLDEVGLGYLGLERAASTLSGGETQRVRLASQLGAGLTGILYVLDEPTIGLHPRDTHKLVGALRSLVDKGNTVLVVEHDTEVIRASDHVIDVGPEGGRRGGRIVAEGTPTAVAEVPLSATGRAIATRAEAPASRRSCAKVPKLTVRGARGHNLKDIDVAIPLGRLVAVTGVSGSGKSTLVRGVMLPALRDALGLVNDEPPLAFERIEGAAALARAVMVDQSPIGRTPRSVPATYVGVWDEIRKLLAGTPDARARGFDAGRFSFNVAHEGRCPTCDGNGQLTIEMAFLPDVYAPCETCRGMRFVSDTLIPKLHGHSAGELLKLEIGKAKDVLAAIPKVRKPLELLDALGVGYLELGQPSNTLSGGEAQRVKLVAELGTVAEGRTLYVLDEPTTGLHREDVGKLVKVLQAFVDRGDTVVVIEHQTDVILAADWVIDMGPEGGEGGGRVLVAGTPEDVIAHPESQTGRALASELGRDSVAVRAPKRSKRARATEAEPPS